MLSSMTMSTRLDLSPITSPDDPRLTGMGQDDVAGADQMVQLLAVSPRERLQYLLDTLDFEDRLHQARRIPAGR
jgi:hypothetical protein